MTNSEVEILRTLEKKPNITAREISEIIKGHQGIISNKLKKLEKAKEVTSTPTKKEIPNRFSVRIMSVSVWKITKTKCSK